MSKSIKTDTLAELASQGKPAVNQLKTSGHKDSNTAVQQDDNTAILVKVTVRMPEDLVKALKHRAIDENRTLQEVLIEAGRGLLAG